MENLRQHFRRKGKWILGLSILVFTVIASTSQSKANGDPIICEGNGERCVVKVNGIPVSFSKGKDKSAIVIKF